MKIKSGFGKFLLLWTGELISSIGGGLTSFGLGVYIFNQTGSAADMALVTLLGFLPTLLFSVPAGVLADWYDRRLLMIIGDSCSALGIVYILFCIMDGDAGLWQIALGVFVSASFSALLEPSFRSTITDILTEGEYSKASGLVSLAGSARYLFSPILAGFLLSIGDVKLLLIMDICTFFLTAACVAVIKKEISSPTCANHESFFESIKAGWHVLLDNKGVFALVLLSATVTMFMGMFQIMVEPMILSFRDAKALGIAETICASGMLISGLLLGIRGIKRNYVHILALSLATAGLCMTGFGLTLNMIPICIFGFGFFFVLPFTNNCMDYLARTSIACETQGRAWGIIGFLSQMGYVIAYSVSGIAADKIGELFQIGVGRGAALVIRIAGICLIMISVLCLLSPSIRSLERH